ncbi:transcription initiation factor TFIID subunit 4-like [Pseudopipra pipra]|uniref:transcription initiation factor TFIID subunit 4-like n=1 Tax=Pseudopipra pipra TaxID=415032 RepID=UPI003139EAAC
MAAGRAAGAERSGRGARPAALCTARPAAGARPRPRAEPAPPGTPPGRGRSGGPRSPLPLRAGDALENKGAKKVPKTAPAATGPAPRSPAPRGPHGQATHSNGGSCSPRAARNFGSRGQQEVGSSPSPAQQCRLQQRSPSAVEPLDPSSHPDAAFCSRRTEPRFCSVGRGSTGSSACLAPSPGLVVATVTPGPGGGRSDKS